MNLDLPTVIITTAAILGAIGAIWGTIKLVSKKTVKQIGIVAANQLQEKDIDPNSYLGQALVWNKKTDERLSAIEKQLKTNDLSTKRLELLTMIHFTPKAVRLIESVYGEYQGMSGNSYISQEVIPAWREKYAKKIAEERI